MNFDKENFSKILIKIKESYGSINQMADKTGVTAAYISKLIRLMYENAPSPIILKKIADNSNGIASYQELMEICGYSSPIINEFYKSNFQKVKKDLVLIGLTDSQTNELYTLFSTHNNSSVFKQKLSSFMDNLTIKQIEEIFPILEKFLEFQSISYSNYGNLLNAEIKKRANLNVNTSENYMCPVYRQISAGQPNWVEENIEGRIPIDVDLMDIVNPEEHFFLRVNGESMNKIVKNGAFALIHKQDKVDNGEIAVVLVNGFDATIKKFTKQGDLVILEPQSNDESFETQVYDKNTFIKILGKYVGKMEINK